MQAGEHVLIHGAAGAVGLFAVQLAHLYGAHVIATSSAANLEFVKQVGADEVIDYKNSRFEDRVEHVDVVFDAVGGETLDRSWGVLKPGGRLATIAAASESTTNQRVKDSFFIVEPDQEQLIAVVKLLDAASFVKAVVPLDGIGGLHQTSPRKAGARNGSGCCLQIVVTMQGEWRFSASQIRNNRLGVMRSETLTGRAQHSNRQPGERRVRFRCRLRAGVRRSRTLQKNRGSRESKRCGISSHEMYSGE